MTGFPENGAACRRVSHPIVPAYSRRVYSAVQDGGSRAHGDLLFHLAIEQRETAIKSNGEMVPRFFDRPANLAALFVGQGHRLFDKDVFARAKRARD